VLHGQFVPAAVELDRPDPGGPVTLALLIEGTEAGLAGRTAQAIEVLGEGAAEGDRPQWWGALPPGGVLVKATAELSGVGRLLAGVEKAGSTAALRGSAAVGAYHVGLPADDPAAVAAFVTALRDAAPGWVGSVVVLAAPAAVRSEVDSWGPVPGLDLMRRVKDRFDPGALLAPGRFVGGI
jgi:glycolate oxidase FAD binding subunit